MSNKKKRSIKSPSMEGTIPHQIDSPSYVDAQMKEDIKKPFINKYGVVIGDNFYDSPNSPLNNWSKDTDPAIMAGDEWVHPTNDIGWNTSENQELLEKGIAPQGSRFMHPDKDVSYGRD
ncbi:MAG TPA: DUF3905 domain-containing protein [Bacillota bacterium]|nr:DUF3905 domain-containing protein [Bacillota bacterium]